MTREEAIKVIKSIIDVEQEYGGKDNIDALNMAISALEQQPCEDVISREAVNTLVDELARAISDERCCIPQRGRSTGNIMHDILDLPSVTQKSGKWIPVSERLPEAFRFVNCTCHSLIDDREDWVVETCYIPQLPDSPYSDWGNIPMLNMGDCEVVAWMYRDIPKPYKVEPQESEEQTE